jgi:hypothetical protein
MHNGALKRALCPWRIDGTDGLRCDYDAAGRPTSITGYDDGVLNVCV